MEYKLFQLFYIIIVITSSVIFVPSLFFLIFRRFERIFFFFQAFFYFMTLVLCFTAFPWLLVIFSLGVSDGASLSIKATLGIVVVATYAFGSSYFLLRFVVRKLG